MQAFLETILHDLKVKESVIHEKDYQTSLTAITKINLTQKCKLSFSSK